MLSFPELSIIAPDELDCINNDTSSQSGSCIFTEAVVGVGVGVGVELGVGAGVAVAVAVGVGVGSKAGSYGSGFTIDPAGGKLRYISAGGSADPRSGNISTSKHLVVEKSQ